MLLASIGFGTDSRLQRNTVASISQAIVSAAVLFIVYRSLLAVEGIEVLGLWSITVGVTSTIRAVDFSGGAALSRYVAVAGTPSAPHSAADYVDCVLSLCVLGYLIIALAAWWPLLTILEAQVPATFAAELPFLVPAALCSVVLATAGLSQTSALDGLSRADLRSMVVIGGLLVFLAVGLLLMRTYGVFGLAVAQVVQHGTVLVAARLLLCRSMENLTPLPRPPRRDVFKSLIAYAGLLQASSIAGLVFDPLARILINMNAGLASLGMYEMAYRIVTQARSLVLAATTPLIPRFAHLDASEKGGAEELVVVAGSRILLPATLLFALVFAGAPAFSVFMLDRVDSALVALVFVLGIAYFLNVLLTPLYLFAQGTGALRWNLVGQVVIAIVSAVSIPLLAGIVTPSYVGAGVALGLLVGSVVVLFGNLRLLSIPFGSLLPWKRIGLSVAVLVAISVGSTLLSVRVLEMVR